MIKTEQSANSSSNNLWSKLEQIEGFLSQTNYVIWRSFFEFQDSTGIAGNCFEIGTWKGRSAAAILLHKRMGEKLILCDISLEQFGVLKNLAARGFDVSDIITSVNSSLDLDQSEFAGFENTIRWFHIDGDHSAEITYNDVVLAERFLSRRGILVIDDFFNPRYVSVVWAVFSFLRNNPFALKLLLVGDNKAYLCRPSSFAHYRAFLVEQLPKTLHETRTPLALHQSGSIFDCETLGLQHPFLKDRTFIGFDSAQNQYERLEDGKIPN
jgi:hypothetical protein